MKHRPKIYNSKGEVITLTRVEEQRALHFERLMNSLGYEVQITTMTAIAKKISEQKYFEIPPADYLPIQVGVGAWSTNITTYRTFEVSDDFETGILNLGGQSSRQAMADAAVDALNIQVYNWSKTIGWSVIELEQASRSGNWDLISAKEESRKKNYDLGIQRIAFLGARGQNAASGTCLGLLNQAGITNNTTLITKPISTMTTTELKTFTAQLIEVYRANCARTAWPTHFIIPESDYNGLVSQASPDFPIKSTLELLEESIRLAVRKPQFKILPLAYGDAAYHADVSSIAGKQIYTLLNYDDKSLRMDLPVPYTNTLANTFDNFNFQNCGYSQFTGALAYRPLEMMYFTF